MKHAHAIFCESLLLISIGCFHSDVGLKKQPNISGAMEEGEVSKGVVSYDQYRRDLTVYINRYLYGNDIERDSSYNTINKILSETRLVKYIMDSQKGQISLVNLRKKYPNQMRELFSANPSLRKSALKQIYSENDNIDMSSIIIYLMSDPDETIVSKAIQVAVNKECLGPGIKEKAYGIFKNASLQSWFNGAEYILRGYPENYIGDDLLLDVIDLFVMRGDGRDYEYILDMIKKDNLRDSSFYVACSMILCRIDKTKAFSDLIDMMDEKWAKTKHSEFSYSGKKYVITIRSIFAWVILYNENELGLAQEFGFQEVDTPGLRFGFLSMSDESLAFRQFIKWKLND